MRITHLQKVHVIFEGLPIFTVVKFVAMNWI